MPELHIIVKPDGSAEIDAQSYSGNDCLEASRPYEKDLGVVAERKRKPEILSGEGVKTNGGRNRIKY
jgi:hypothetical protein